MTITYYEQNIKLQFCETRDMSPMKIFIHRVLRYVACFLSIAQPFKSYSLFQYPFILSRISSYVMFLFLG